jgi:hypothetical protein
MSFLSRPRLVRAFTGTLLLIAALGGPVATYAATTPAPRAEQPRAATDGAESNAEPTDAQPTEIPDDGFDGEVVYDPYFISPEPDETVPASPAARVTGSTARPGLTPPATDVVLDVGPSTGGSSVPLLMTALAVLSITVYALGRVPGARVG